MEAKNFSCAMMGLTSTWRKLYATNFSELAKQPLHNTQLKTFHQVPLSTLSMTTTWFALETKISSLSVRKPQATRRARPLPIYLHLRNYNI